jgi:hypothetical protein
MNTHEIHPSELDKQWEPYYLYVQKLSNIMTKGGVKIGICSVHAGENPVKTQYYFIGGIINLYSYLSR